MILLENGNHFAGSVDYDNNDGEWEDTLFRAKTYKQLVNLFTYWLSKRENAGVFFAVKVVNGVEIDIKDRVEEHFNIADSSMGAGFAEKDLKPMDW